MTSARRLSSDPGSSQETLPRLPHFAGTRLFRSDVSKHAFTLARWQGRVQDEIVEDVVHQ